MYRAVFYKLFTIVLNFPEDFPSPQPWFEETIPPDPSTTLRASSGSTTTPLYFGIGVHIEPIAEYMEDFVYQRDSERLRCLAEIVAAHGEVLTIQTQTSFDDKAQQLGDTIFADLAAQGHEIALHFHEDAHIPDADDQPVEVWVTTLEEGIDLIEELSGVEVRTWSGSNVYAHLYEAAEEVGLEVNLNYKNRETQQSDERFTILTPWRPAGATSVEERTTHDPDGAVIYIPSGVFPAHCDKLEGLPPSLLLRSLRLRDGRLGQLSGRRDRGQGRGRSPPRLLRHVASQRLLRAWQ
jgi:hypothetical protein